jgi:hypothetical protein
LNGIDFAFFSQTQKRISVCDNKEQVFIRDPLWLCKEIVSYYSAKQLCIMFKDATLSYKFQSPIPSCYMISMIRCRENLDFYKFSTLHTVNLSNSDITDVSPLSNVQYLILCDCDKIVKGLETLFPVRYLEISENSVQNYNEKDIHHILFQISHVVLYEGWFHRIPDCRYLSFIYYTISFYTKHQFLTSLQLYYSDLSIDLSKFLFLFFFRLLFSLFFQLQLQIYQI